MNTIEIENVSKAYGKTLALDNISFTVPQGELFGLIGPDGAGKTSLFKILVTLRRPDSGQARVLGKDVVADFRDLRNRIGYMPGRFSLYPDLSVEENLAFFATVFGTSIKENYELIKDIYQQLEPFKNRRAGALSGGMKQKLALCCSLIHDPEVLFLDEPTTGVDAVSRKEFWEMLRRLRDRGLTILVSTPYMDEATLCDRIALIQGGKILAIETPQGICNLFTKPLYAVQAKDKFKLITDLRDATFTQTAYAFGERIHVTTHTAVGVDAISQFLQIKGHQGIVAQVIKPTIEDSFMALM